MAHAFAKYADSLRDQGETARALGFWRQAIDLAPEGPDARYAAARVALYDGLQAVERGNADIGAFKRALALDPSLSEARAGLTKAQALHSRRRWLQGLEAAAALFGIGFLLWLLWKKSGSSSALPPPPPPTAPPSEPTAPTAV